MSDKREKIIQGALRLFTQKGIDATSTASIAKEAGVGTGTVFHYFSSKEELTHECFLDVKKRLQDKLREGESKDFFELGRIYWDKAIRWYLDHERETQFLLMYQHDPKMNEGQRLSIITKVSGLIMDYFKLGKEKGHLNDLTADYMCLLAHQSTILAAQYLSENPDVDKSAFIQSSCDVFLSGVLKLPAT